MNHVYGGVCAHHELKVRCARFLPRSVHDRSMTAAHNPFLRTLLHSLAPACVSCRSWCIAALPGKIIRVGDPASASLTVRPRDRHRIPGSLPASPREVSGNFYS